MSDQIQCGPCCICERVATPENPVRTMAYLPRKAPVPGTGWGCVVCHLATDGAIAVVCDECAADAQNDADAIKFVASGLLAVPPFGRVRVEDLGLGEHVHDMRFHPETDEFPDVDYDEGDEDFDDENEGRDANP